MPSLKEYRNRIAGVQNTKRITSAMKMVAAAKLRRAQQMALASRPYSEKMYEMVKQLAQTTKDDIPELMTGRPPLRKMLFIVIMTDRGLCGALNTNLARTIHARIQQLTEQGREVRLLLIGRKSESLLAKHYPDQVVDVIYDVNKPLPNIAQARTIAAQVMTMFEQQQIDGAQIYFNYFASMLSQKPLLRRLIPVIMDDEKAAPDSSADFEHSLPAKVIYDFEPNPEAVLTTLLPRNLLVQIYRTLVENYTSELAARMTSMDNATRNAEKIVDDLTLEYNRQRQSAITRELSEIVAGATTLAG